MGESRLDVQVNAEGAPDVDAEALRQAAVRVLAREEAWSAELSVTLLDDVGITDLNRRYLGKDRPTDVIAFSLGEAGAPMGDVYIGVEQARRQAGELGVDLAEELIRLTVHGTLHVLGHDHPEGDDRLQSPMFVLQERLVREILEAQA